MNIIITGASKGIGWELCKKFIKKGNHNVIGISRSSKSFGNDPIFKEKRFSHLKLDLSNSNVNEDIIPFLSSKFDKIDILINNAGLLINKPFKELTNEDFDALFNVNVKSIFRLVRDLLPIFNKGAHIVNISSMGGFQGSSKFPGLSLYSASKGALAILTECMAEEFKENKISANALALGAVQTEMLGAAFPGYKAPLSAKEMAEFIYDFAINGQKYFNGKILPVSLSTP